MIPKKPFVLCPRCNQLTYGVLSIHKDNYSRRCSNCWYPGRGKTGGPFPLPPLNKKIIYLDQFAVSNMMKSINPKTKAFQKGNVDSYWREFYERLDVLCRMQLILCPDSTAHTDESMLSPHFEDTKRLYEQLSHGSSFEPFHHVKQRQVCAHARDWIDGIEHRPDSFDPSALIHGRINSWHDHFFISSNQHWVHDMKEGKRNGLEAAHLRLTDVFKRWQSERGKSFDDWFREECLGFGKGVLRALGDHIKNMPELYSSIENGSCDNPFDLFGSLGVDFFIDVREAFIHKGLGDQDATIQTVQYFQSLSLQHIPFLRITSMLWAALARKAASGQTRPPSRGMEQDIETISVLLPYCNAMFIDKECHALLSEEPLCSEPKYGTNLYSLRNKDEFSEYLDRIEQSASEEHLAALEEVYGDRKPKPNTTLFSNGKPL